MKKGQVTIFIIVGVLMLGILFTIIFINTSSKDADIESSVQNNNAKVSEDLSYNYFQSCFDTVQKSGIRFVSRNGGYFVVPVNSKYALPVYYDSGENLLPELGEYQKQLRYYIEYNLESCFYNLTSIEDLGYNISGNPRDVQVQTTFADGRILSDVNLAIKSEKNGKTSSYSKFRVETKDYNLLKFFTISEEMMKEQQRVGNNICLSCLKRIEDQNNVVIKVSNLDEGYYSFEIDDKDTELNEDERLDFNFIYKYTAPSSEPQTEINIPQFAIEPISDKNVSLSEDLYLQLEFTGEVKECLSFNPLVDVDDSGFIHYEPDKYHVGNHTVKIRCSDEYGQYDSESFNLKVE